MRKFIADYIKRGEYLIHADMFNTEKFPTDATMINVGIGEANALNVAGGLSSQGSTSYVYGVAGFIMHRLEQMKYSCKLFGAQAGKVIIFNAGAIGYDKFGKGHEIKDDYAICKLLGIEFYQPKDLTELNDILNLISNQRIGIYYIQLGKDYER